MSVNVVAKYSIQPAGGFNVLLDIGQHGHPDQSADTQPHALQAVMQCVLTPVDHDDLKTLKPPGGVKVVTESVHVNIRKTHPIVSYPPRSPVWQIMCKMLHKYPSPFWTLLRLCQCVYMFWVKIIKLHQLV